MDNMDKTTNSTFSGINGYAFQNWAKTWTCKPELFFEPRSLEDLKHILFQANENGKVVKICGSGHSIAQIACCKDYLVSLKHFNKIEHIDHSKKTAKIQAGMVIRDLNEALDKEGLGLPILGSISDQALAGAISTGTHGYGIDTGILSSYIVELELMKADGEVITLSRNKNEEVFLAACCSVGALGIITSITMQCDSAFDLHKHSYGAKLEHILEHFETHARCSSHFKLNWYPGSGSCIVEHAGRTDKPRKPDPNKGWFRDIIVGVYLFEFLLWLSTFLPFITNMINTFYYKFARSRLGESIDRSDRQFNFNCKFSQYVMEWAVPIDKTALVTLELKAWIENNKITAHFPIEIRPTEGDDIFLSNAYGGTVTFINIIIYRPYGKHIEYEKYWQAFQKIMMDAGGRPHWAKPFTASRDDLKRMYPKWEKFCEIRKELDPEGRFLNESLKRWFDE